MVWDKLWTSIISLICLSSCLARPTRKSTSHSGDTQALENSGIDPLDVMNNSNQVVRIHKFKKLYSKNSAKFVRIHNGKVDGKGDRHDANVLIRMESAGSAGQVILKTYDGSVSLCLDQHGTVVAMPTQQGKTNQSCVFIQDQSSKGYTRFRSLPHGQWYLGITKDGRTKSARKTLSWQRSVQFIEYPPQSY
ncbi:Fibroblast growth factor 18 [Desmophyllum pertusum]|uniref:Fibroblast growth factor 18 n=1 Tax=Desmophyllum pertusum TaxID=174260 RepID=A0A9W9ZPH3_9CNID|nr:Fibroblast growth factor 18 [Desmophyllum pertusum]